MTKHPAHDGNEVMMTVREVAEYLRVSAATVYKWARDEKIPCHRFGRLLRFKKHEIDELMKEQGAG